MKFTRTFIASLLVLSSAACWAQHSHEHKGHSHGGEAVSYDLGTTSIAGIKVSVIQEVVVEAGSEAAFDVVVSKGQQTPKAIRTWYGISSGEGSVKAKAEAEDGVHFHCHVEIPKPIPSGSRFWVEVVPEKGSKAKASFKVKAK